MELQNIFCGPIIDAAAWVCSCYAFYRGVKIALNRATSPRQPTKKNTTTDFFVVPTNGIRNKSTLLDLIPFVGKTASFGKREEIGGDDCQKEHILNITTEKVEMFSNDAPNLTMLVAAHRRLENQFGWNQLGDDIDGEAAGDQSGYSVSMSSDGNRLAIGAPLNNGNGGDSGNVRIYHYNDTSSGWDQLGQDIDGEAGADWSGYSVSMSSDGNRLAIGASKNDDNGGASGHVQIYQYNDTSSIWDQLGQDIDGETGGDESGFSVSMSSDGNQLAIGGPYNDDVCCNSGHVRIYHYNDTSSGWDQLGQDIDGEAIGDWSGYSVSMSSDGNRLAIGAPHNDGNGSNSGSVRVYLFNDTSSVWDQLGQDIDGEANDDWGGFSVSMSSDGNRLAIGAHLNNGNGGDSGNVRIYQYNDTSSGWDQLGQDIDGEAAADWSGSAVSMSSDGNRLAIGARYNDGNGGNAGHTRIYHYNDTSSGWEQLGQDIDGEAAGDWSGFSVSMSSDGNRLAIGARSNDGNGGTSGHVRVYYYNDTSLPGAHDYNDTALTGLPPMFDFDVAVDQVTISLTSNTNFSEAIVFGYNYTGVKPKEDERVSFTYDIREADCEKDYAPSGDTSKALYFKNFDESVNNKIFAKIGVNLTTIEAASAVWTQDNGETEARLAFCGVWNIFVNNVLFQFHESNVTASINLREDGGFEVDELGVGLDRKEVNTLEEDVEVEFPIDVFLCNSTGTRSDPAPTQFNQGDPIQVCLQLETETSNVFVQSIDTMVYSAMQAEQNVTLIDGGALQYGNTAEVDCGQIDGLCRVHFLAVADMYAKTAEAEQNILFILGSAVIAFGTDNGSRRQIAFTGHSDGMRRMQEDVNDGEKLAPFDFVVKNLQPQSGLQSIGIEHGVLISVLVASLVVVVIAGAASLFLFRRKRMRATATAETPGLDKDGSQEDSSSQPAKQVRSEQMTGSYGYEIAEV